jgi:methylmalonyl-CoA mutase
MQTALQKPKHHVRFVTAASLYDGHDASINIMRRLLQAAGVEVVHLGHNRSVEEIVDAAIQEDAQGIAVSSYQGGHVEFFKYMKDLLVRRGAGHVKVFGGGGGTIVPREIAELQAYGIDRIFSPEDGRRLGLEGMINEMTAAADFLPPPPAEAPPLKPGSSAAGALGRLITCAELNGELPTDRRQALFGPLRATASSRRIPVVGVTGTGGAGKSSFIDELVRRYLLDSDDKTVAVLSVDPTKRKTGGALLGDRIRMNAIQSPRVFMRSLATRGAGSLSAAVRDAVDVVKAAGHDLVIVETPGVGQGDSTVVDHCDVSVYVMTPEYGAPSQLEKIDMLDFADVVVLNKFERPAAEDALRDVRKQVRRARNIPWSVPDEDLPVFGAISSQFHDEGVTAAYQRILRAVREKTGADFGSKLPAPKSPASASRNRIIPAARKRYLAEIAETCRAYRRFVDEAVASARRLEAYETTARELRARGGGEALAVVDALVAEERRRMPPAALRVLEDWPALAASYAGDELVAKVRDKELRRPLVVESLAGLKIRKIALPKFASAADLLRFLLLENLPGRFPFTAGVFELKRTDEDPKRQFAGEGPPERTNRRFHYLSRNDVAKRLSTAFDSVTLYGQDPDPRPDIYGKVGESGVSICTLDDMKKLYAGFDLCDANTSVSMTINGPAPTILAFFFNTAVDQQVDRFRESRGRIPNPAEHAEIVRTTLQTVRGTVQADILKEDQAQNTCIFSTEFALRMMGDVQKFFVEHGVRNYYSVSISGYHIAEAGANPISQLAFTLANGFTYVEYYLARGMKIDDVAPNLSFFFSNGLDPEYTVIGRVARRIWATALRDRYGASERGQKLKYHIQTSGRSLHAQEVDFNDIRTTLQALIALQDHCNSLHTNAYDEAVTTPTEESVRRAMAIQLIINKEYGAAKNENPLQGSFFVEELTDLVEAAVLAEFDRLAERGGVLGAMETQYQRGKIQEESLKYEHLKHVGELPIVGVNTFVDETQDHAKAMDALELTRATTEEKDRRIAELRAFQERNAAEAGPALRRLREVALDPSGNVFAELMRTARVASLGQITRALFEVGGQYRRNL